MQLVGKDWLKLSGRYLVQLASSYGVLMELLENHYGGRQSFTVIWMQIFH